MATEVATPTPAPALEPAADAPPAEQGEAVAQNQPADTDAQAEPDRRLAQAEYTRAQQAFALAKAELGLDPKATREEFLEAVRALKLAPKPASEDDSPDEDPRVAEYRQRAWDAQFKMLAAVYPDYAGPAIEYVNLARTSDDPEELVSAFAALVEELRGERPAAPAPVAEEEGEEPVDVGLPGDDLAPSGSSRTSSTESAPYRRRESAVVGAVRGIFASAGLPPRQ